MIDPCSETKHTQPPFLKWAGGKRWLISEMPNLFKLEYNNYIEPFLGSGAVFFYLTPQSSILSDTNKQLIDTYRAIRDDWKNVEKLLKTFDMEHSQEFYYKTRDKKFKCPYKKAAQFIYLNRTCFNGFSVSMRRNSISILIKNLAGI